MRAQTKLEDPNPKDTGAGMLRVVGLSHRFSRNPYPVLEDVSLEVPAGGFTTVIGPSGCGKTTLLRIAAGLLTPDRGEVYVDGRPSLGPSSEKAMVFQAFNLLPWRSALANVAYGLELQGVGKKDRYAQAEKYLELVGLVDYAHHYPRELSGGMQQRVGLARALAVEPKVLLMDEPFGALDALTREYLQTELQKICDSAGATALFITHSIDEAIYLSDRVLVMGTKPGRIVSEFEIPLPRPRWTYHARSEPAFVSLRDQIWDQLQIELGGKNPGGNYTE